MCFSVNCLKALDNLLPFYTLYIMRVNLKCPACGIEIPLATVKSFSPIDLTTAKMKILSIIKSKPNGIAKSVLSQKTQLIPRVVRDEALVSLLGSNQIGSAILGHEGAQRVRTWTRYFFKHGPDQLAQPTE